jgi:hypothetical protein
LIETEKRCHRACGVDTAKKGENRKNDDNNRQHGGVVNEGDDDKDEGDRSSSLSLLRARRGDGLVHFVAVIIIGMPTTNNFDENTDNQPPHVSLF